MEKGTWIFQGESLPRARGIRVAVRSESGATTFADALTAWCDEGEFRSSFNAWLAAVPFSAFRWEMPPVTAGTANRPFEFVVLDSPGLARTPDPGAFGTHMSGGSAQGVVAFPNLGGDATLVVPCQLGEPTAYGHLAAFVRDAPESQQHALWRLVGQTMLERISDRPVWLNTAGGGVAWLHVRLDDRPKYYSYAPFRKFG